MRFLWLSFLVLLSSALFGQIEVLPIKSKSKPKHSTERSNRSATTTLPFWDDFSTNEEGVPGDQWEFSGSVQVTAGLPFNPPTYKAATFDGVDSTGNFYSETETFSGRTDQLISKVIDLSSMTGDESIYLSFFWEAGGNGEHPEDAADSLRLQLLDQDSVWVTVWARNAPNVADFESFTQEIVHIASSYRHEDFRFKFESFGSQQGQFDTWHVDYVYMNSGRTASDLTYKDRAFTGQLQSIIFPYNVMPAHHFFRDPSSFLNYQSLAASNLTNTEHTLVLDYELEIENTGEIFTFDDSSVTFASGETKQITLVDTASIEPMDPLPDSIVFINTVSSVFNDDLAPINLRVNDTLRNTYLFYDHYAYDDGTAEFIAGVRQQGSVAIEFAIGEQDTLTHIDIYFPSSSSTAVGKTLSLNVWDELDGSDPISSKSFTVTEEILDQFVRVQITDPIVVVDTIFIGYKQDTNDFLPIGLDRSNLEAKEKMYYLRDGLWLQNEQANGVMMIRPIFRPLGDIVLEARVHEPIKIFPNPTNGIIKIEGQYQRVKVFSLAGQELLDQEKANSHDISALPDGMFLLQVLLQNASTETFRLIKE